MNVCNCSTGESVYLRRPESRVLCGLPSADVAEEAGRLFEGPCAEQIGLQHEEEPMQGVTAITAVINIVFALKKCNTKDIPSLAIWIFVKNIC